MALGDIDGELDAAPMRRDWEAALKLAQALGDKKLENRASGELGFALFLEGDMTPARQRVAGALMGAMMLGDNRGANSLPRRGWTRLCAVGLLR